MEPIFAKIIKYRFRMDSNEYWCRMNMCKIKSIYSNGGYEWIITERKFKCENGVITHHTHKK